MSAAAEPTENLGREERRELRRVGHRYHWLAAAYDWLSLERQLYASARARAVELLRLQPGATVLDVACGTGQNFALIERRIGPTGRLIGVDFTPEMLEQAQARARREGWTNVTLLRADAARLPGRTVEITVEIRPFGHGRGPPRSVEKGL